MAVFRLTVLGLPHSTRTTIFKTMRSKRTPNRVMVLMQKSPKLEVKKAGIVHRKHSIRAMAGAGGVNNTRG